VARVSFDLDGVLVDYLGGIYQMAQEMYPGRFPKDYAKRMAYDFEDVLRFSEWMDLMHKFHKAENLWEALPPLQPNLDDFRTYAKSGKDEIFIITARPQTPGRPTVEQTMRWFTKHDVPVDRTHVYVVKHSADKAPLIKLLGVKFSTDDLYTTIDHSNEVPGHKAFLFTAPWNTHVPDMPRVDSIAHFIGTVRILG
jgi:phosphoglycolate phosphatase-like HAD superfamily hydrolase